jgi:hypothetical protein
MVHINGKKPSKSHPKTQEIAEAIFRKPVITVNLTQRGENLNSPNATLLLFALTSPCIAKLVCKNSPLRAEHTLGAQNKRFNDS